MIYDVSLDEVRGLTIQDDIAMYEAVKNGLKLEFNSESSEIRSNPDYEHICYARWVDTIE